MFNMLTNKTLNLTSMPSIQQNNKYLTIKKKKDFKCPKIILK